MSPSHFRVYSAFVSSAFVSSAFHSLNHSSVTESRQFITSLPCKPSPYSICRVHSPARMSTDPVEPTDRESNTKPSTSQAPSFDTQVFSNFVDSMQQRLDTLLQSVRDIDVEASVQSARSLSLGLVDNLVAGDWLNRGELYGAIQLVFVVLLLRGGGLLGGLLDLSVSFITGPALLVTGAAISAKAVLDLGPKQISIWPAPVPDGELKSAGVYEYVRHPMYAGVLLASAGFAAATASPSRLALTVAFAAFLAKKIDVEEEFLMDAYPQYQEYIEQVQYKLLPKIY